MPAAGRCTTIFQFTCELRESNEIEADLSAEYLFSVREKTHGRGFLAQRTEFQRYEKRTHVRLVNVRELTVPHEFTSLSVIIPLTTRSRRTKIEIAPFIFTPTQLI